MSDAYYGYTFGWDEHEQWVEREKIREREEAMRREVERRNRVLANIKKISRHDGETTEEYKNRLRSLGYTDRDIPSFINGTHPHLRGKPDA